MTLHDLSIRAYLEAFIGAKTVSQIQISQSPASTIGPVPQMVQWLLVTVLSEVNSSDVLVESASVQDDASVGRTISHAMRCAIAKFMKTAPTLFIEVSKWKRKQTMPGHHDIKKTLCGELIWWHCRLSLSFHCKTGITYWMLLLFSKLGNNL